MQAVIPAYPVHQIGAEVNLNAHKHASATCMLHASAVTHLLSSVQWLVVHRPRAVRARHGPPQQSRTTPRHACRNPRSGGAVWGTERIWRCVSGHHETWSEGAHRLGLCSSSGSRFSANLVGLTTDCGGWNERVLEWARKTNTAPYSQRATRATADRTTGVVGVLAHTRHHPPGLGL